MSLISHTILIVLLILLARGGGATGAIPGTATAAASGLSDLF